MNLNNQTAEVGEVSMPGGETVKEVANLIAQFIHSCCVLKPRRSSEDVTGDWFIRPIPRTVLGLLGLISGSEICLKVSLRHFPAFANLLDAICPAELAFNRDAWLPRFIREVVDTSILTSRRIGMQMRQLRFIHLEDELLKCRTFAIPGATRVKL